MPRSQSPQGGVGFRGGARPPAAVLVRFISDHKCRFGVEPICRVLTEHGVPIVPSAYYDALRRPPSARAVRDERLKAHIVRLHADNYGVYGARKVWLALNRAGTPVARCTVERLMGELGLLAAAGIDPSAGTVGDACDNALAESVIGRYKSELVKPGGPWRTAGQVELATPTYVDWFNHRRLYQTCGDIAPAELEDAYYRQNTGHNEVA